MTEEREYEVDEKIHPTKIPDDSVQNAVTAMQTIKEVPIYSSSVILREGRTSARSRRIHTEQAFPAMDSATSPDGSAQNDGGFGINQRFLKKVQGVSGEEIAEWIREGRR